MESQHHFDSDKPSIKKIVPILRKESEIRERQEREEREERESHPEYRPSSPITREPRAPRAPREQVAPLPTPAATSAIKTIRDLRLAGKTVFMRLDFNVPLSAPDAEGHRTIEDDTRIREALPTIRYAIEQGSKLVLASHLGRPDGERKPEFSLLPVAEHLAKLLGQEVILTDEIIGEGIEMMVQGLKAGQVLLLENLRFHKEEEANDVEFARKLARLGAIYITDAFGTAHRKHASTYGIPSITQNRGIGFLIEKELKFLDQLLHSPGKPFYAVLGGSKVSDKIKTIDSLLKRVDGLAIGGAMAHAFWAVQGDAIPAGAKQPKPADIEAARAVLATAKRRNIPVLLPSDTNLGFDIGPKSIAQFKDFLSQAKTIFWNGPLGWFEKPEYSAGTFEIARAISEIDAVKVVGGGDTVLAIKQAGVAEKFDHLSTGGGAVLEYLEGEGLPGIDILRTYNRQSPESPTLQ
ncbi:MAG: phosphoglycerate kinase [Bdellovibrionales bacterium]|nr:phosphoglycerate kinase [Bdellovibrionales bacterium]